MTNNTPVRERCGACQQLSPVSFAVPNEIWNAVVHSSLINSIICLKCFIDRADEKYVPWDKTIEFLPISRRTMLTEICGVDLSPLEKKGILENEMKIIECDCDVLDKCPQGRIGHTQKCKILKKT